MRRYLTTRLSIIALVLAVVTLISGVAWAANNPGPSAQVQTSVVEIQPIPMQIEVGGTLQVAGAGFQPNEWVLFEIVTGSGPNIVLEGGQANSAGAFLADTTNATATGGLPDTVTQGVYTIVARTAASGHVASAPLVVVDQKKR